MPDFALQILSLDGLATRVELYLHSDRLVETEISIGKSGRSFLNFLPTFVKVYVAFLLFLFNLFLSLANIAKPLVLFFDVPIHLLRFLLFSLFFGVFDVLPVFDVVLKSFFIFRLSFLCDLRELTYDFSPLVSMSFFLGFFPLLYRSA